MQKGVLPTRKCHHKNLDHSIGYAKNVEISSPEEANLRRYALNVIKK